MSTIDYSRGRPFRGRASFRGRRNFSRRGGRSYSNDYQSNSRERNDFRGRGGRSYGQTNFRAQGGRFRPYSDRTNFRGRWNSRTRGGRSNRYDSRNPAGSRSTSNPRRSSPDSSTLNVLSSIMDRLESLERRDGPHVRFSTDRASPPSHTASSRPFTESPSFVHSTNSDFRDLIRESFRYAQIAHHLKNWHSCPRSISSNIDQILSDIRPPMDSEDLRIHLSDAGTRFKSLITAAVSSHLHGLQMDIRQRFDRLDKQDLQRARPIIDRLLRRRLAARWSSSTTTDSLTELYGPSTTARSVNAWQTVQPTRRSNPQPSSTQPVPTSNRFSALQHEGSDDDAELVPPSPQPQRTSLTRRRSTEVSSVAPQSADPTGPQPAPISTDASAAASTVVAPLILPAPSVSADVSLVRPPTPAALPTTTASSDIDVDLIDALMFNTPSPPQQLRIHHPYETRSWRIVTPTALSCLIIADSNGQAFTHSTIPPGFHIESFRGAHIQDAAELLETATSSLTSTTNIVVALGINDRRTFAAEEIFCDLQRIRDWGTRNNKRVAFVEIPALSSLTDIELEIILHMNNAAQDIFGENFITIDHSAVHLAPNDKSGVHFAFSTAQHILSRINEHFFLH